MINLVSLLVAAALVSLQSGFEAYAQHESKNDLDNNLEPNVVPASKQRFLRRYVNISNAPPESISVKPGTRFELVCEIIGHPAPTAQWLKNGEPIVEYDDINEIINIHASSVAVLVSKLVMPATSSGDVYTCVATSGIKQMMASTTVYYEDEDEQNMFTLQSLFRKPSKPVITEFYSQIFQDIDTSVVLPCRHFSPSPSQVYWVDSEEKPVFGNPRMRVLPSGDLVIPNLHWDDMGSYFCTVKNAYGKDMVEVFLYPTKKTQ